jgi:hypothetical protein
MDLAALRAVRKYGRSFLLGAERRSAPDARHALELVLNGRIGKVQEIYVVVTSSKSGGSATPVLPVPKGWDYDLWLGPAPEAPFCADRVAEGIFQIRDYSLGMIANWGAHPLDQVQFWADQLDLGIPLTYEGTGRIAEGGLFNCVSNWRLRCTYRSGLVMHFMDSDTFKTAEDVPKAPLGRSGDLALFVGTDGWVASSYEKITTHPESLFNSVIAPNEIHLPSSMTPVELIPPKLNPWAAPAAAHQLGWIAYLKSEKDRKPPKATVDPIESAVRTDLISQLSEICVRSGRTVRWDPEKETIAGDKEAAQFMSLPMRDPWKRLVKEFSTQTGMAG